MSSRVMVKDLISGRVGDQKGYSGSSRCVYTWEMESSLTLGGTGSHAETQRSQSGYM